MAKTFDATLKDLIAQYPRDWLHLLRLDTPAPISVIDTDLATVSAASDKILRIDEAEPWFLHVELVSRHQKDYPEYLHWYNALVRHKHQQKVRSWVVLLHSRANSPQYTGEYVEQLPPEPPHVIFRYHVLRLWQMPPETFLQGGLGVLPLAPLSQIRKAQMPALVRQLEERVRQEATPEQAQIVGAATILLSGLRWPTAFVEQLFQGASFMNVLEDSSVYQAILAKGETKGEAQGLIKEARKVVFRLGRIRFGPPHEAVEAAVNSITDLHRLEELHEKLLQVSSWQELLTNS